MYRPSWPVIPVTSARFMQRSLRGEPSRLAVLPAPVRVQLAEEFGAPLLLVVLADGGGSTAQAIERAQEALIGRLVPSHIAGPAPSRLAEPIEPAVVPH